MDTPTTLPGFRVERVAATENPQRLTYLALHNDYSEEFCPTTSLSEQRCGEIAVERLLKGNRHHWGPLEHPQLSLLLRADHNTIMQLRTHRIATFDVQSMRYSGQRIVKVVNEMNASRSDDFSRMDEVFYFRPPGTYRDRQGDPYEWTQDDVEDMRIMAFGGASDYAMLRQNGVSEEHARFALPTCYFQNAMVSGNLRFWMHLLDIRGKADAQDEIRVLMKMIAKEIEAWVPEIYAWYASHRLGKALLAP